MSPAVKKPGKAAASAAAARAETASAPEPKSFDWRGLSFSLPDKLPATVAFDLADLENSDDTFGPLLRFLTGILGAEQVASVRNQLAQDGDAVDDIGDILSGLLGAILDQYGMSLGE